MGFKPMKIAFFIPHITRKPGFENNVSAHVQLPCEIARRLKEKGHQVEILTDSLVDGYTMPTCLPHGIEIVQMADRAFVTSAKRTPLAKAVVSVFVFIRMAFRIRNRIVWKQYDIAHFFGTERVLILSKVVSLFRPRVLLVMTFNQCIQGALYEMIRKSVCFWRHLDAVVVSMEKMKKSIPAGVDASVIRHGVVKKFSQPLAGGDGARASRVLFWRTPDHLNGGDICIEVFRKLAPLYPDIDFDLAVRAESPVTDLDAYERDVENGHVFRFPYPDGITLESLLAGSCCVFQPFRGYTYYPQLVILESLMNGIPVVASDLPGVEEMVQDSENGYVFPLDNLQLAVEGIRKILEGEMQSSSIIRSRTENVWSWDGYEERLLSIYNAASGL